MGTNPWRYRVYITQTAADGTELHAEFLAGKRMMSEAVIARDNHVASMTHGPGWVDDRGVTWDVVIRDEPLPEFPA